MILKSIDATTFEIIEGKRAIQKILKLRYQVLVSEYGYLPKNETQEITDEYDFNSNTIHIGAFYKGSQLVGANRIVINSKLGIPSQDYFDFLNSPLPSQYGYPNLNKYLLADISRLVATKKYHGNKFLVGYELMKIAHSVAKKAGASFCCAAINPRAIKYFRSLGYCPLDSEKFCDKNKLPFIPMIGAIDKLAFSLINEHNL